MTRLNIPPAGDVCGKRRHYSPVEAQAHVKELEALDRSSGRTRLDQELHTYWCDRCEAFHVGHRQRKGGTR